MFGPYIVSDVVIRAKQWRKRAQVAKDGSSTHVSMQMYMVNSNVWFKGLFCMCVCVYVFCPIQDGKDKITFAEHVRKRALTEVCMCVQLTTAQFSLNCTIIEDVCILTHVLCKFTLFTIRICVWEL